LSKKGTRQNNNLMKIKTTILAAALIFGAFSAHAQGSGKVTLKADIESANEKHDLQISLLDLATKELIQRDVVSNLYHCTLPLNQRYMLHFQKEGHPVTRLIIDTNAPVEMSYFLNIHLKLNNSESAMETGISVSAGKIIFDEAKGNFDLAQEGAAGAQMMALTYTASAPTIAKY
jgi:hypothetical protein